MNLLKDSKKSLNCEDYRLTISDIQLDVYRIAFNKGLTHPHYEIKLKQYLTGSFQQMVTKLENLDPNINNGSIFSLNANPPCFNYKTQFLRITLLKCLTYCLPFDSRKELYLDNLHLLDNPEYIPIYKKIMTYLIFLNSPSTLLWFFFQTPNYINYNIDGYRKVYETMLNYGIQKIPDYFGFDLNKTENKTNIRNRYEIATLGTTYYYNMVYHGKSNKYLFTQLNILLRKIYPQLKYEYPQITFKEDVMSPSGVGRKVFGINQNNKLDMTIRMYKEFYYRNNASIVNQLNEELGKSKIQKIKICFISDKLIQYTSVFRDRIGIIKNLDDKFFDVYIGIFQNISLVEKMPIVNHFLKPLQRNNKIISLDKYDLVSNAKMLEKHNFHIIFYPDLGMKQAQTLLAHNRLAPIQITTWGHSDTSGNPSIDYFITSKYFEQVKDLSIPKNNYSETPILLKELGTFYYSPRKIVKELLNPKFDNKSWMKTKKDFGFPEDCIVIGCLQSFYKFNEEFEDMLYRILDITQSPKFIEDYKVKNGCSPKPVYMALSNSISFNKFHLERIRRKLDKFSDRIVWFQNKAPDEWMNLVSICHLMLDPFPFGGCNTTLEAIDYHIPVVYLPSLTMINGRFTHGFYQKMGINNFQTNNKKEYIDKVYQLLTNNAKYFTLKNELRMKKKQLFENRDCVIEYQHMFIKLIERHIVDKKNMK